MYQDDMTLSRQTELVRIGSISPAAARRDSSNGLYSGSQFREPLAQTIELALGPVHSIQFAAHKARIGCDALFHPGDIVLGFVMKLRAQRLL